MRRVFAILVLCVSITILGAVAEASDVGCGAILGPGGHFALDSDVGPCPGAGAAIPLLDGARLYLRGFTISCEAFPPGSHPVGVLVSGNGALVHNGTVTGCEIGVNVQGDGSRIALVRTQQIVRGFHVTGDRNVLTSNTADGTFDVSGDGNTLYRNVSEGPDGGVIAYGQGNRILGNRVQYTGTGFLLWGAHIVVLGNGANFNDCIAFEVSGDHVTVRQNSAYRNGCDGLRLTVDASDVRTPATCAGIPLTATSSAFV